MRKLSLVVLMLCIFTVFVSGVSAVTYTTWNDQTQSGSATSTFLGHTAAVGQYQGIGISGTGAGTQMQAMNVNSGLISANAAGSQLQGASVKGFGSYAHLEQSSAVNSI
jgi:hypothetical protein